MIAKLRSFRFGQFAVFDFAMTFLAAYYGHSFLHISRKKALWLAIPLGILVHKILKIDTPLNRLVDGPNADPAIQMIILVMLIQGLASN